MNRRVLVVLLIVVALLAIAPQLPRWLPAISTALHRIDLAAVWTALATIPEWLATFTTANPWLLPAIAGAAGVMIAWSMVAAAFRRRTARRAVLVALEREEEPIIAAAPAPVRTMPKAPPAAAVLPAVAQALSPSSTRFARPATAAMATAPNVPAPVQARPPRLPSERRQAVRRLYADGRTTAEIARATGIGQDAIRGMQGGA